ncbi:PEFG-CTERM sorting domain-containing protein [Candidatus Nitrosopelagicus sp.]|nr:PEFG-CTERM sorting domain-containing protein [Candidatus Nitrosopelagicus sp.]
MSQSFASSHDEQLSGSGITLDVTTDKEAYNPGETITVSGNVHPQVPGTDVILRIISPQATNIIQVEQLEVDSDGNFSGNIETDFGGAWKNSGTYVINVFYWKDVRVDIQFDYGMTSVGMQETMPVPESIQNEEGIQSSEIVGVEILDSFLVIDGINVNYTITNAKIISITPDLDAKSLIIKISTTDDGELVITLPKDVIDTDEEGFFVLVDGEETAYIEELHDNSRTLTIPFYYGSEEIEVIGTFVIPEFGLIGVLVLAISIIAIIAVTSKSRLSLMPKL